MVKIRKNDKVKFLKVFFPTLDRLINLLISGKLTGKQFGLFLWMCSYAWFVSGNERNEFTIPISAIAKVFEVKRGTVEKWLKTLSDLKLIRHQYHVIVRSDSITERKKTFKTQKAAFTFKNKHGGTLVPSTYKILVNGIRANMGKENRG